ncbi:MAG: bacterio-opsin activator domain-containing protein [Natrialbaceae archaeon]|nr:bacterio-opsin activator domain-containing protein [Natrialbaceae archaeon]
MPSEDFQLGTVLSGATDMLLELERIVPTGPMIMPFIWATGDNHDAFEKHVQANPAVTEFLALDTINERALYRIEWAKDPTNSHRRGGARTDAIVFDACGNEEWTFRLCFSDQKL